MTYLRDLTKDASVSVAETAKDLSAIHQSDCPAVVWHRNPMDDVHTWLETLSPAQLPKTRMILRPDAVRNATLEVCETSQTPKCAARDRFVDDVAALADIFAKLMNADWLRLRLDVVSTNACRRFHIDALTARLVCTYRGTGTQYGIATDGADPARVFTVPTGAPIVLRGTLWPEHPKSGLLHRSPPIEGTGETRLVLVLDPVADPEREADPLLEH